jgi:hypothetical protein
MKDIYCELGLGNRVAAIAATLATYGCIAFHWRQNSDMPTDWRIVFPNGITNVVFVDQLHTHISSGHRGQMAFEYFDDVDYSRIMATLAGKPHAKPTVAVQGRFHRERGASPLDLVAAIPEGTEEAFVLCDSYRKTIIEEMEKRGIRPIMPISREMASDFDRLDSDTLDFISDWQTLCLAELVITNCPDSSALYPLRQNGAKIITA